MEGPSVNWALESKSRMPLLDFEHWFMGFAHCVGSFLAWWQCYTLGYHFGVAFIPLYN